jgi:hypothetical protein
LIHLINMMRHRRVKWAAMDFLLASYRKHRRWVWLKQLMLLALRMLAIAAVVAMLAQLVSRDQWSRLFGYRTIHHFVLLDDSLSMSERTGVGTAFDRGRRAITQLTVEAAGGDHQQQITLIRYSRAARANPSGESGNSVADLNAAPITGPLESLLTSPDQTLTVSQLAVDVQPALEIAERLMRDTKNQRCVLHLVSDFRASEWSDPAEVRETLNRIAQQDTKINLIRCVERESENLVVESLAPEVGTQAAAVPLFMSVGIRNVGGEPAEGVRLRTRCVFHPTSPAGTESAEENIELPDIVIDRIEAGERVTRSFQVFFPTSGHHVVSVQLPGDALQEDNHRWCVVKLDEGESALIVDGDLQERSAYYLESIFRPGAKTKTGITPTVQTASYLRDATAEELARHRAIYLLDVPALDTRTLANLRTYVENGGGLAWFLGPNANAGFLSNAYESGLFPLPVELPAVFESPVGMPSADIQFEDHPIFRALAGQRNPFAASIRVRRYLSSPPRWTPPTDAGIAILARLPNGQPLAVERSIGAGRSVAFLTTLAPDWNNWSLEPSFIVVALQLHAYLAQPQRPRADRLVGEPLTVQLDARRFQPEVTFLVPTADGNATRELVKTAGVGGSDASLLTAKLGALEPTAESGETDISGIYTVHAQSVEGGLRQQRYALNVDVRESRLDTSDASRLRQTLEPINVAVYQAEQRIAASDDADRNSWSEVFLWLLLAALLIEQFLAYRLSYHPSTMPVPGGPA